MPLYRKSIITIFFSLFFVSANLSAQQSLIDSLEHKLTTSIHDTIRVNTLVDLAWEFTHSDNKKFKELGNEALALARKMRYKNGEGYVNTVLGMGYEALGDVEMALKYYDEALIAYEKGTNLQKEANAHYNIAITQEDVGEYRNACTHYEKAIVINTRLGNDKKRASSINGLGATHYYLGDFEKALSLYIEALGIHERVDDQQAVSVSLNNIGSIHLLQNNLDKALSYMKQSLKIKVKINDERGLASGYLNIGGVYFNNDQLDSAEFYWQESLRLSILIDHKKGVAICYNNLGNLYKRLKKYQLAISNIQESIAIKKGINDMQGVALSKNNLASTYILTNESELALNCAIEALEIAKSIEALDDVRQSYEVLASIYAKKGNHKVAYEYRLKFALLKDSLFNINQAAMMTEIETKYQIEKKERQLAELSTKNALDTVELNKTKAEAEELRTQWNITLILLSASLVIGVLLVINLKRKRRVEIERTTMQIKNYLGEIELLKIKQTSEVSIKIIDQDDLNNYLLNPLSEREMEVLAELQEGMTNKQIAEKLFVSANTVKTHTIKIYNKLDVGNRTLAVKKASDLDLLKE